MMFLLLDDFEEAAATCLLGNVVFGPAGTHALKQVVVIILARRLHSRSLPMRSRCFDAVPRPLDAAPLAALCRDCDMDLSSLVEQVIVICGCVYGVKLVEGNVDVTQLALHEGLVPRADELDVQRRAFRRKRHGERDVPRGKAFAGPPRRRFKVPATAFRNGFDESVRLTVEFGAVDGERELVWRFVRRGRDHCCGSGTGRGRLLSNRRGHICNGMNFSVVSFIVICPVNVVDWSTCKIQMQMGGPCLIFILVSI